MKRNNQKPRAVFLGRFAPFHIGHKIQLDMILEKYGIEHVLVLVGSANVLNERTPYTFEQRKDMIQTLYPYIEILPLNDIDPSKLMFETTTIREWIAQIHQLADSRSEQFIFCSGSETDVSYLASDFPVEILNQREIRGYSATEVRRLLALQDFEGVSGLVNERILHLL